MAGGKSREIKNRIKGVKSTHQITKAMDIVSSTKYKKFVGLVQKTRPYSEMLNGILENISAGIRGEKHPLFDGKQEVKKIGLVVMASDRGLCGSFNNNILKEMEKIRRDNPDKEISIIAIGKKVRDYCKKRDYDIKSEYIQLIPETMFEKAKEIGEDIVEFYTEDIFDEVHLVYSKYLSAVSSEFVSQKIIPIQREEVKAKEDTYVFEPSIEGILTSLLPKYLNIKLYQAILETTASEHAARKQAMKNATDNAEDMMAQLTLQYNRERQAAITQELSEIVGGAAALK
jgi:F-type H+-transporting ATPase subunit gamma